MKFSAKFRQKSHQIY